MVQQTVSKKRESSRKEKDRKRSFKHHYRYTWARVTTQPTLVLLTMKYMTPACFKWRGMYAFLYASSCCSPCEGCVAASDISKPPGAKWFLAREHTISASVAEKKKRIHIVHLSEWIQLSYNKPVLEWKQIAWPWRKRGWERRTDSAERQA